MSGPTLEGRLVHRTRSRLVRLLAGLSGVLLLLAVARFLGTWLVGLRRPCSVSLDDAGLVVDVKTYLAGKLVRSRVIRVPTWKVGSITREERFRHAHLLVGAMFFLLGAGLGFALVVEWAWTQFGIYLLMGLGAIVLGIALDLAVVVLVPVVRDRSAVILHTDAGILRVDDVLDVNAEQFLAHATEWIRVNRKAGPSEQG